MKFLNSGTRVSDCPSGNTRVLIAVLNAWKVIIIAPKLIAGLEPARCSLILQSWIDGHDEATVLSPGVAPEVSAAAYRGSTVRLPIPPYQHFG